MFGPLSRANKSTFRRTRLIIVIIVIIGILLGNVIYQVAHSSSATNRLATKSYVAAISPVVTQSDGLIPLVSEVRKAPGDLGSNDKARVELFGYLSQLLSGAKSTMTQLSELGLRPPSTHAGVLIATVLNDRFVAVQGLYGAISLATGPDRSPSVTARAAALLAEVGSKIAASDSVYQEFVASLPRGSGDATLPSSDWSQTASWDAGATTAWAHALVATPLLIARPILSLVAISLDPPAVTISGEALPKLATSGVSSSRSASTAATTTTSSTTTTTIVSATGSTGVVFPITTTTSVIPATSTTTTIPPTTTTLQIPPGGSVSELPVTRSVKVVAVVADAGNATVNGVVVRASLTGVGTVTTTPSSQLSSAQKAIGSIAPGGARYVELAPLGVQSGDSYLLTVVATPSTGKAATAKIRITIG